MLIQIRIKEITWKLHQLFQEEEFKILSQKKSSARHVAFKYTLKVLLAFSSRKIFEINEEERKELYILKNRN